MLALPSRRTPSSVTSTRARSRFLPRMEQLEDRCLMSNVPLDATFATGGKRTTGFDLGGGHVDRASRVAVQADGKVVVIGAAQGPAGDFDFAIARYNVNGTLDATFNGTGKQTIAFNLGGGNDDRATGLAIAADGKIVVGGYAQVGSFGDYDFAVARLNANGSLDTSFATTGKRTVAFDRGGAGEDKAAGIALQADGKIVLAGHAQFSAFGDYDFAVARLNANGALDTAFNGTGKKTIGFDRGGAGD